MDKAVAQHPDDITCRKFLENPKINPVSKRAIGATGAKYKELVKLCQQRGFDVSNLDSTISKPSPKQSIIPIPISKSSAISKPVSKPSTISKPSAIAKPVSKPSKPLTYKNLSQADIDKLYFNWQKEQEILENEDIDYSEEEIIIQPKELPADDNFVFDYNNKSLATMLKSIQTFMGVSLYTVLQHDKISLGQDTIIFLNELANDLYDKLSIATNNLELINELDRFEEDTSKTFRKMVKPNLSVKDNIINVITYLLEDILNFSSNMTRDARQKVITFYNVNYVISNDDMLKEVFNDLRIKDVYLTKNLYHIITLIKKERGEEIDYGHIDIEGIYRKYGLLIPPEFDKYLKSKNIELDEDVKDFLYAFLYYNFTKKNCGLDIEDYLDVLLNNINNNMSYKQLASTLIRNPVC